MRLNDGPVSAVETRTVTVDMRGEDGPSPRAVFNRLAAALEAGWVPVRVAVTLARHTVVSDDVPRRSRRRR